MKQNQYGCIPRKRFSFKEAFYVQESDIGISRLVVSVHEERLFDIFLSALDVLDEPIAILLKEALSDDINSEPEAWQRSYYANGKSKKEIIQVMKKHLDFFLFDGNHQIGFQSQSSGDNLFIDDHNLILIYTKSTGRFQDALKAVGLRKRLVKTKLNVEHDHISFGTAHRYLKSIVSDFGLAQLGS